LAEAKAPQPIPEVYDGALNGLPLMIVQLGPGVQRRSRRPESASGHARPGRAISISNHVRYATKSDDRLSNCDPSLRAKGGHSRSLLITFRWRAVLATLCLRT